MNDDESLERHLRAAVLAGDETAWRAFYDRAFQGVLAFVAARLRGARDEVEEATQETWLVAVKRIESFDPSRGAFEAWVVGVADHVLKNRARGNARRAKERPLDAGCPEPEFADRRRASDAADRAAAAFAALPSGAGEVLRAKYRDGFTVGEIAARSGRTVKAVESALSRARAAFRRWFQNEERMT